MTDQVGATEQKLPADSELLDEVARHQGIDALSLTKAFTERGYEPYSVQRIIQRNMDKGTIEVGSRLKLYIKARQAA